MLACNSLLLTGVGASAAQNAPVNKICSQCGAVLVSGVRACNFCDHPEFSTTPDSLDSTVGDLTLRVSPEKEWRGELNQRLHAYRARRRKSHPNEAQSSLPFDQPDLRESSPVALQMEEPQKQGLNSGEDFAFTIAIGRPPRKEEEPDDGQMVIDVSLPPLSDASLPAAHAAESSPSQLYPVASLLERRRSAMIDAVCLAFAYGGFLALFGSLGGHFTLDKLSAAVCFFTFAFVYLQYFCLFTIFGGTTPGMMVRGLHVASFSGEQPTAQQLLWRAIGYLLSASTFFLGFFWALWDEDGMTWHDRLSRTCLAMPETFADTEISHAAPVR